ncbi:hypothetical protein ST37_04210 [Vibrio sp. qd031]|uniref:SGNH/GDSL hydrolase family protein n=1 Tax=Vibrio sp. qd031 TaxID=1603038 RepID=UPI000A104BB8|nr:SGNH/GDSL hydrolase family protein [Vibrio sp. qd031]ORT51889.1 hypothetical protein ST37_04210 [Vibrio sp. qd031]
MKKILLLGGSNSIIKAGLNLGLCDIDDIQLALGASSCLQNIHAIVSNNTLIQQVDVVVTESNVNDSYNVSNVGYCIVRMKESIRLYYEELYRLGKAVFVLLLPVKQYSSRSPEKIVVDQINNVHRELANEYGYYLVDVDKALSSSVFSTFEERVLQPDSLHMNDAFMYCLGANLRNYILRSEFEVREQFPSNYYAINLEPTGEKSNSKFSRSTSRIAKKTFVHNEQGLCVGVETWSDGPSQLIIEDANRKIVKGFNKNLSFNELDAFQSKSFSLESVIGPAMISTENSVNVKTPTMIEHLTNITSLLFIKNTVSYVNKNISNNVIDISSLIPDFNPFLSAAEKLPFYIANDSDANILRSAALQLEKKNVSLSLKLMTLAAKIRPSGVYIKSKVKEYKALISQRREEQG